MSAHNLNVRNSHGRQLRVEPLESRNLLAVMAEGFADPDAAFTDVELTTCECAPTFEEEAYVLMIADAEPLDDVAAEADVASEFEGELLENDPYYIDYVMEFGDPLIVCTMDDSAGDYEIFMAMSGVVDGEWAVEEWIDDSIVTFDENGEVPEIVDGEDVRNDHVDESHETDNLEDWIPIYTMTGTPDETPGEASPGELDYDVEVTDVDEPREVTEDGGEGDEPVEWADAEVVDPYIYTMTPTDGGESTRGETGELPVDSEGPVVITTIDETDGEISDGEILEEPTKSPSEEPSNEAEEPEIVTFGGESEEGGGVITTTSIPSAPSNNGKEKPGKDAKPIKTPANNVAHGNASAALLNQPNGTNKKDRGQDDAPKVSATQGEHPVHDHVFAELGKSPLKSTKLGYKVR